MSLECVRYFQPDETRGLSQNPCDLEISLATYTLVNATEAYKTLNNISTVNRIFTGFDSRGLPYVFIGDADSSNDIDFSASTVAVGVECKPISKSCNLSAPSTPMIYHCSDNFTGDLSIRTINGSGNGGTTWRMNFFNDSKLTQPTDTNDLGTAENTVIAQWAHGTNPVFIAMGASVSDATNGNTELPVGPSDSDIVEGENGEIAFILLCNATVYNATYTWINGSFANFTEMSIANENIAAVVNGPQQRNLTFGLTNYFTGAILSTFSSSAQEVADKMALVYGQTALGIAAGVFVKVQNLEEQTRQQTIVAQIPYSPLYTLVAINLLCAAIGVIITITALRNKHVGGVSSLLTVWGVVAHAFEPKTKPNGVKIQKVEDLFQETREGGGSVVGIDKEASGNWRFKTWPEGNNPN
jgi:hypothetical protein